MSDPEDSTFDEPEKTQRLDEDLVEAVNAGPGSRNQHVEMLARTIGPRKGGSQEEKDAADYLISALDDVGLPAARLRARAPRSGQLTDILPAGAALLATIVALLLPAAGLVLLIVVLAIMVAVHTGFLKLSAYLPDTETVNVLAIVPPAEADVRRLIVTSTLDSGAAGILARRHRSDLYGWLHAGVIAATVLALLITLLRVVDSGDALRLVLVIPLLGIAGILALLFEREEARTISPGAITNASGVAAMIEIARSTVVAPPRWLEVWFLGVGGSASHGGGMNDFLARNTFDPDTTYFVHLQSPGGGPVVVPKTTGAGLRTAPATPLLTWIFDSVKQRPDGATGDERQRLAIPSLATNTHSAGYQSVVVAGVDESGRVPYLHNEEDQTYNVQDECIDDAARLVALAIDALDREVAARAMLARSTASIQPGPPEPGSAETEGLPTPAE